MRPTPAAVSSLLPPAPYDLRFSRFALVVSVILVAFEAGAQPVRRDPFRPIVVPELRLADYSECPDCTTEDIRLLAEVMTRYQGLKGRNPSAPSTYNLIGKHKFSGTAYGVSNSFFGENWYPIRTEKQILTGTFHQFGVSNYGDESDWNIHLLPDPGFEGFLADAIPYRKDNWYASGDWRTTADGKFLIEAEITPDERRYGNPWFNNKEKKSPLINRKLSVYGPFVREEAHGNHPEIHPCEQIWWKEGDDAWMVLLIVDDSNRFKRRADTVIIVNNQPRPVSGDYSARRVTTFAYHPWAIEKGQEAELSVAFELDPMKEGLYMSVQAVDDLNFYAGASYPDASQGDKNTISYRGNVALTVQEAAAIDQFVGVTFRDVCFNRSKGTLQGYVVLTTAIGNGDGKEGFVALRIDRKRVGMNTRPTVLTGDLLNRWEVHSIYDDQVTFSDIISSDMHGKGIVHGKIDFNGNGKTDFFAKKGDAWMVLYDGKGAWQQLNTSSVPVGELRFGDVNGDGKTDILRVSPRKKVEVSYGGTGRWTELTDAGEQHNLIQVGDFNGDGRTDIVYMKYDYFRTQPSRISQGTMYVKYSAQGPWRVLNRNYSLHEVEDDYIRNFRFGNFNGDRITDIFRYRNGKFVVYWNGTGDLKELCTPGITMKTEDLLFVDNLTTPNYTDVIYVDRNSKKWTVFYHGRPGSAPLTIKYADPALVRFGDLDADPATEPFALDFVEHRLSPLDIAMTPVAKANIQPTIVPRYVPGSLKRIQMGDRVSLTASMNVAYSPGTQTTARMADRLPAVASVRDRSTARTLSLRPGTEGGAPHEVRIIASIDGVPLSGSRETEVELTFAERSGTEILSVPAYSITAIVDGISETAGGPGSWRRWKDFVLAGSGPEKAVLVDATPFSPSRLNTVGFELLPFFTSLDKGKVRLVEMDDMARELNEITYGNDSERKRDIFGTDAPFTIVWQFELRNVSTGGELSIPNPARLTSDGRWRRNKIFFTFPDGTDLMQFRAWATVTDPLGNRSPEPLEFVFWNQRIELTMPESQIPGWLEPIRQRSAADYQHMLTKALFLAEDSVITPEELRSLLR